MSSRLHFQDFARPVCYNEAVQSEEDMGYMIADNQRAQTAAPAPAEEEPFIRTMAFPEGEGSHTKVAVPDEIEDQGLRIGAPEPEPGVKIAAPEPEIGKKVARPSIVSKNGDFRRPIQLSGPKGETDALVDLKLNKASLNPMMKVQRRR